MLSWQQQKEIHEIAETCTGVPTLPTLTTSRQKCAKRVFILSSLTAAAIVFNQI